MITNTSRDTIVSTATTYLDALVTHDAGGVLLASDVQRIGNGSKVVAGADALRAVIRREPVGSIGTIQWVVDGNNAACVYELDADLSRTDRSDAFGPPDTWIPSYVAERFTVVDGLITEIEVVYAGTVVGRPRPARPERYPRTVGADAPSRESVIDAASAYLGALVSHDGSSVPLAPGAWRVENGVNSGDSGPGIATALGAEIMRVITGVRDEQWFVEDDVGVVFYTIDVDLGLLSGGRPDGPKSAKRLGERFRVWNGMIAQIEAVVPTTDL